MLWPGIGQIVARSDTKAVLRRVLEGGLHDRSALPRDLLDEMYRCGTRRGHPRAFRSLCLNWRSWITAREGYGAIEIPVTLVYGEDDWSRVAERDANADAIAGARRTTITNAGHFSCLEKPRDIAQLIGESSAPF